ncbi:MAG: folate-binding protein [Beijerinckiaceae bacterium]
MPVVLLSDRSVVSVSGTDARVFLQGLVTCDMDRVAPDAPAFGALLTPQGKILFDFFVVQTGEDFLLDAPRERAADLVKRLGFYRLRSKVQIEDLSSDARGDDALAVVALFGDEASAPADAIAYADPREASLGRRIILPRPAAEALATDAPALYEAHRIACGVPKGGLDFAYGDAFPHETNMDLLHGVAFDKGCYVGQEVVSRMQHRGLARKRVLKVEVEGDAPPGADIRAAGISVGALGGVLAGKGLATLRTDRLDEAKDAPLTADGARLRVLP